MAMIEHFADEGTDCSWLTCAFIHLKYFAPFPLYTRGRKLPAVWKIFLCLRGVDDDEQLFNVKTTIKPLGVQYLHGNRGRDTCIWTNVYTVRILYNYKICKHACVTIHIFCIGIYSILLFLIFQTSVYQ